MTTSLTAIERRARAQLERIGRSLAEWDAYDALPAAERGVRPVPALPPREGLEAMRASYQRLADEAASALAARRRTHP